VKYVGVFRQIAQDVGMKAGCKLLSLVGGRRFQDGLVHLTLFENFRSVSNQQIANIAAKRVDARLGLRRVEVNVELVLWGRENRVIVGTFFAAKSARATSMARAANR